MRGTRTPHPYEIQGRPYVLYVSRETGLSTLQVSGLLISSVLSILHALLCTSVIVVISATAEFGISGAKSGLRENEPFTSFRHFV